LENYASFQPEVTVRIVLTEKVPAVAVMVAAPAPTAVARPVLFTVPTDIFDELQVTCLVISWLVPSEYVPMAVNCWLNPTGILGLTGATAMEDKVAGVTVKVVLPMILPKVPTPKPAEEVAAMVTVPAARPVARPVLFTVPTDIFDELQVTCVVISWLVPSEYVPMAVNCWLNPTGILGLTGATAMEDKVAGVTVKVVLTMIMPEVAVMVTVPAARPSTRPWLFSTATNIFDVCQRTCEVISRLVPSEYVPVAVNCWLSPTGRLRLAGATAMEDKVAELTVRIVVPETVPEVAVMVAAPAAKAVARPVLLTVATDVFEEFQVTCVVISRLVPSENVPVAVNCWVTPSGTLGILGVTGITTIEIKVPEFTVRIVLTETVPKVAVMIAVPPETAVAKPLLLTVATSVFDEFQVACVVISKLAPSEKVPMAVNCSVSPTAGIGAAGVTVIEDRVAGVTVRVALPSIPPELAVMVTVPGEMAVARPVLSIVATAGFDELHVTCVDILGFAPRSE
jgi:spore maturation protein SpmB